MKLVVPGIQSEYKQTFWSRQVDAKVRAMANCWGLSMEQKFEERSQPSPVVLSVWMSAQSRGVRVPLCASIMMDTTLAKNSSVLRDTRRTRWMGSSHRHARPREL